MAIRPDSRLQLAVAGHDACSACCAIVGTVQKPRMTGIPERARHDTRVAIRAAFLVVAALSFGCGRSAEEVRWEFDDFVAKNNQCASAAECTTVAPGCPLGCLVAVRTDRKSAVSDKAADLIDQYERGGARCNYKCAGPSAAVCEQNRCALAAGGNGQTPPANGSPAVSAHLDIVPSDGITAHGAMDILLRFYEAGLVVDEAKLTEVAAAAFLQTWPERQHVAFTTEALPRAQDGSRSVRLVPTAALESRWHIAGMRALPAGILYWTPLPDGTVGHRFHPASQPRIREVSFCLKAGSGMKLLVTFSEPVMLTRTPEEIVGLRIAGALSPCSSYSVTASEVYFTCDALSENATVAVDVGGGVVATSGVGFPGGSWSIDIASLPAGSCRAYQPSI